MTITVNETGEPTSVTLTFSPGSDPFPSSVTFEALDGNGDVGTGAVQVAAGDHLHTGVYEPADATILKSAAIGTTVQDYDADTAKLNVAQAWQVKQTFTETAGTVVNHGAAAAAETFTLDGQMHIWTLADATASTFTPSATGSNYLASLVRIFGSAAGTGTLANPLFGASVEALYDHSSALANGEFIDFVVEWDGTRFTAKGSGGEVAAGVQLDAENTWTAKQTFSEVQSSVVSHAPATAAESIPLDGQLHVVELVDAQATEITGTVPAAGAFASVAIKGSATGTGTVTFAAGHVQMNDQALTVAAGAWVDFALDSPDGTTIRYRGTGVQQ